MVQLGNLHLYCPKRQDTSSQALFDNVYQYCFIEINKNTKINIPAAQYKELTFQFLPLKMPRAQDVFNDNLSYCARRQMVTHTGLTEREGRLERRCLRGEAECMGRTLSRALESFSAKVSSGTVRR